MPNDIKLEFGLEQEPEQINELIDERTPGSFLGSRLIDPVDIKVPGAYKKFLNLEKKEHFRQALLDGLQTIWTDSQGIEGAQLLTAKFRGLASILEENGAIIFGELINKSEFQELITAYEELQKTGCKSWIHSYVNLGNYPEFLTNQEFNGAFLHPLLIALVAYSIGGAIRIVDGRAKDAEPISVLAQDNMLHIDNTPFNDEYKIILTWEKGKPSGPKGQNFVYIPGTQKGVRDCSVSSSGEAWSTENGSIFINNESIDHVFEFQKKTLACENPIVVEAHHPDKPLTTVFSAGSLVHHRYRTETASARSCMILAFHRIEDNPGQFLASTHVEKISQSGDLNHFLFGKRLDLSRSEDLDSAFIHSLLAYAESMALKIDEINSSSESTEIIEQTRRELTESAFLAWKSIATQAPTVEALKTKENFFPLAATLSPEELEPLLVKMIMFDKHGPLDLILYGDNHEEIRKWARNRIREMPQEKLTQYIQTWIPSIAQPDIQDILTLSDFPNVIIELVDYIDNLSHYERKCANVDSIEKISSQDVYRSMRQLITDLGESIVRCDSRQAFLSTGLFVFLACNELRQFSDPNNWVLKMIGQTLLNHYIATTIAIQKQIHASLENSEHCRDTSTNTGTYSYLQAALSAKTPTNEKIVAKASDQGNSNVDASAASVVKYSSSKRATVFGERHTLDKSAEKQKAWEVSSPDVKGNTSRKAVSV